MSTKKLIKALGLIIVVALLAAVLPMQAKAQEEVNSTITVCESGCTYSTIQAAIDAASAGDTILVSGTFVHTGTAALNKDVTLTCTSDAKIQVSGTGHSFRLSASGSSIEGCEIEKTDKQGVHNIISLEVSNVAVKNNNIHGQYVFGEGDVSRAMEVYAGSHTGLEISGNEIWSLRQPAYINGNNTGTISNNYVHETRGWVVAEGNMTFTGNTWGAGAEANVFDIAILSGVNPIYYTDIPAISAANNNAFIEDQRYSPARLTPVFVNASAPACTSDCGTARAPYNKIQDGINRVIPGGTVNVAAGTYQEALLVNKAVTLLGPNAAINPNGGERVAEAIIQGTTTSGLSQKLEPDAENVVIKGFTFDNMRIDNYNGQAGTSTLLISGVVVENNIFSNVMGTAVYLRDGRNAPGVYSSSVSVTSNKITSPGSAGSLDYDAGSGILVYGAETSTISGNVITNAAYNGIQLGRCSAMTISNNVATGAIQPALQIAQWNAGTFAIRGNTFSTSSTTKAAVRLYGFTNDYHPVFNFSENTIEDSLRAIQIGREDTSVLNDIRDADYSFVSNTFTNISSDKLIVYLDALATETELTEINTLFAQVYGTGAVARLTTSAKPFTYKVGCGATCYVSPTGSDANSGLETAPFLTIQKGIDSVSVDGTVHVAAGTYDEENILITKGITLQGAGAANTFIAPSAVTNNCTIVVQNPTGNVTIDGFNFVMQLKPNYGSAVLVSGTTIPIDSVTVTISNNVVTGSNDGTKSDYGFYGQGNNAKIIIKNNTINRTGDNPIVMEQQFGSTTVENNTFYITASPDYDAYYSMVYSGKTISTPQIVQNNVFHLDHGDSGYSQAISFTTAVLNAWGGQPGDIGHYTNIQVLNNTIYTEGPRARGIGLNDRSSVLGNGTITGSVVTGNKIIGEAATDAETYGITLRGDISGAIIQSNEISNVNVGFRVQKNLDSGSTLICSSGTDFSLNKVTSVPIAAQNTDCADVTVDASPNWWGSVAGPGASQISGPVDFTPWCTNAECTTLAPASGVVELSGTVSVPGGILINEPNLTYHLAADTVIKNSSPCFVVNASYTQILAEPGAKCIPTGNSNGIDVAAGLTDIRVKGLEILPDTGAKDGDGIHFAGIVTDVALIDNKIHNMPGDGVFFGGQPAGVQDIHGNLFQNNGGKGIEAGTFTVDATYNSWGSYDGPVAGDGVSANVDADPWTHADITVAPVVSNLTSRVVTTLANVSGRPTVLKDGNVYHMWYGPDDTHLYHTSSTNPAEFPAGTLVTFTGGTPAEVASPAIIKEADGFKMIAYGADNSEFALYTSADGTAWTKGAVVFDGTGKFGSDFVKVDAPFLFKISDTQYRLYFQVKTGSGATLRYNIYAADSTAIGGTYALVNGNAPVLSPAASTDAWDGRYVMHPWVVLDGTTYYMWYSAHNDVKPQQIGVATSTDGLVWTKSAANPVIGPVGEPAVIKDGNIWRIWYLGDGNAVKYQSALSPLDLRQTLAYQVTANLQNVNTTDVTLNFPKDLLSIAEITPGTAFNSAGFITATDGSIQFIGSKLSVPPAPVTAQNVVLFNVTFHTDAPGSGEITFGPATFGTPGAGSSTNVYLAAAADTAAAQVNELPALTTTFGDAYYLVGDAQTFQVVITNKGTAYANAELRLGVPADVGLTLTTSGYTLTGGVVDLGTLEANETVTLEFSATISSAGAKTISFDVYDASSLLFSTVETATVYTKPVINSTNITGPYQVGFEKGFMLTVDNVDNMASPVAFQLHFDFPEGTVLKLGTFTTTCTSTGCDVPVALNQGNNTLNFLVTFDEPVSNGTINVTLNDTGTPRAGLATKAFAGLNVYGNIASVTGTVSMQGRLYRGGVRFTLTGDFGFGPYNATSIDQLSNNVVFADLASGTYTITVTQARYLEVPATLGKTINIGTDNLITALQLRGGDVQETDTETSIENNVININDASLIGSHYGITVDDPADANFDLRVNIQDLALVGGNFGLTSATAYNSWTP